MIKFGILYILIYIISILFYILEHILIYYIFLKFNLFWQFSFWQLFIYLENIKHLICMLKKWIPKKIIYLSYIKVTKYLTHYTLFIPIHIYLNGQYLVDHYLTFLFHWRTFLYVVYLINKFYIEINMFFISQGFNPLTTFLSYNYFIQFWLIWWNLWCHKSILIFNSTTTYTSVACAIGPSMNSFPNSP